MHIYKAFSYICPGCGEIMNQYRPGLDEPYLELMCTHSARPWNQEAACIYYNQKVRVQLERVEVERV